MLTLKEMTALVLSQRELNRATLARQALLERETLPVVDLVERLGGLQAQVLRPPYIGLWSRLTGFTRAALTEPIMHRRIVRATYLRATLHLVSAEDYLRFRPVMAPALARALNAFHGREARGLEQAPILSAARAILAEGSASFATLRARLAPLQPDVSPEALAFIVRAGLPLVQVPTGGPWAFPGNPDYAMPESWLGRPCAEDAAPGPLIRRYLAAFGPAAVADCQAWIGMARLRDAFAALRPELVTYRDEWGAELFDLPDGPLPSAATPAPPRFLPEYDNLLLAHADRTRVVADQHRSRVFLSAGRVRATILVDGMVAGTWRVQRQGKGASLVIEPFAPLPDDTRAALLDEGTRLLRFMEDKAADDDVRFASVE